MTVRELLTNGDFNSMNQSVQADGSTLCVITRRNDPHVYKLWVKNLYQPNEQVIKEEII
jgi:hypothetical protein